MSTGISPLRERTPWTASGTSSSRRESGRSRGTVVERTSARPAGSSAARRRQKPLERMGGSPYIGGNVMSAERKGKMSDILGVIGGSGLYGMEGLRNVRTVSVKTPFGDPSDAMVVGELEGRTLAFLPRHGRGHRLLPSQINYRANLYALKKVGVQWVLSISAV